MQKREEGLYRRQTALIDANVTWLRQALTLLDRIDDRGFGHQVGSQLRHVIEFYECFLDGLESSHIDYDARKRDQSVERSRGVAAERICSILQRLEKTPALRGDSILFVAMEDRAGSQVEDPYLYSSVARELQALSSHTIHHFALIAMTLRMNGFEPESGFGVAPSTLRYHSTKAA